MTEAANAATKGTCALSVTDDQLSLIVLAAVKFAAPQRGNSASRAVVDAVAANRSALGVGLRKAVASELRANAYTSGDPWTDMDSEWMSATADLLEAE